MSPISRACRWICFVVLSLSTVASGLLAVYTLLTIIGGVVAAFVLVTEMGIYSASVRSAPHFIRYIPIFFFLLALSIGAASAARSTRNGLKTIPQQLGKA